MGTVIPIDFKRRRRTHAGAHHGATPGMDGQSMSVAVCIACLACVYAPLLMSWSAWLPAMHPQAPRVGTGVDER